MKRLLVLVALSATVATVLFGVNPVSATEKPKTNQTEKTTTVVVVPGDTLTSIAERYNTTYVRLFNANPQLSNPDQIDVGNEIRIPKTDESLTDRYSEFASALATQAQTTYYYAPSSTGSSTQYSNQGYYAPTGSTAGNTYYQGYCTWYAKNRRPDLPNMLGNGGQWTANAAARGYSTGTAPRAGAIAEVPGHVMYVEEVYGNGTMKISEMNGRAGFGNVDSQVVSTSGKTYIY